MIRYLGKPYFNYFDVVAAILAYDLVSKGYWLIGGGSMVALMAVGIIIQRRYWENPREKQHV